MLIALAFAHFSSELLLKEQMIIPVKKTLNNTGHIDAKLIDFSEICLKKSSEIGCFLLIISWRSFPPKFPVKSADFSKNLLLKILRNLTFFQPREIGGFFCEFWLVSRKKSREIGQFFCEFWLASGENPAKLADFSANFEFFPAKSVDFSANLPLKIPRNFAFFPWNIRSPVYSNTFQYIDELLFSNEDLIVTSVPFTHLNGNWGTLPHHQRYCNV